MTLSPPAAGSPRMCCILNEKAGRGERDVAKLVRASFARHGLTPEFLKPDGTQSLTDVARSALGQGYDTVVCGGGDGTINAVAGALLDTEVKLGVLPLGTLNHFARDLNIPLDLDAAVQVIVDATSRKVDVGEVNGHVFLNNSSVGLYPSIVRLREGLQKHGYKKWLALLRASISMLTRFRTLRLALDIRGKPAVQCRTAVLFIGNNTYDTTLLRLGKRAALDRGHLWAMMPAVETRWKLIRTALALVFSGETPADIISFETESMTVSTRHKRLRVSTDGEIRQMRAPLRYRTRPQSLHVLAPGA